MKAEGRSPSGDNASSSPKRIFDLLFSFNLHSLHDTKEGPWLYLQYYPLIQDDNGNLSEVHMLLGDFALEVGKLPDGIRQKLETLEKVVATLLPSYEVDAMHSAHLTLEATIRGVECEYGTKPPENRPSHLSVEYSFPTQPNYINRTDFQWESLSRSQQLVVSNIASWVKKQAWEHLANKVRKVSGQPSLESRSHQVFISYKKNSNAEAVAELVSNRLAQKERIGVWFDKWEVRAGDSIPGKIGEGFKGSDACLIFLSHEYDRSNWCTKEMNTALAKAISENLTIIPSLVEACNVPELLKDLKRVDFIKPTAPAFEQKLQEITDAIYKVDLNPYR
jgi:hypothetical protein